MRNDLATAGEPLPARSRLARLFRLPFDGLSAGMELPLSPRGLPLTFLLLALGLTFVGWLRPPFSPDLVSYHLPLGIWKSGAPAPEEILGPARTIPADSAGLLLLGLIGLGTVIVLARPGRFVQVAGLLLCGAVAVNAAAVFNHPELIELVDFEQGQRGQIVNMLSTTPTASASAAATSSTTSTTTTSVPAATAPPTSSSPATPATPTITSLSAPRVTMNPNGNPSNFSWGLTENAMSSPTNGRVNANAPTGRVSAAPIQDQEWGDLFRGWWYLKYGLYLVVLAAIGITAGTPGPLAHRLACLGWWTVLSLAVSSAVCSQRWHAEYHWIEAKLREGVCDFGGARQALDQAVALCPEFERMQRTWLLAGKLDYRQGRNTARCRFYQAYQYLLNQDYARAIGWAKDLQRELTGTNDVPIGWTSDDPAVRNQMAAIWTAAGVSYYQSGLPVAAYDAFRHAAEADPAKLDNRFYMGTVHSQIDYTQPDLLEEEFGPVVTDFLEDRILRADTLTTLGYAYFEAGRLREARQRYAKSSDIFSLPKVINYRAHRGLGGL